MVIDMAKVNSQLSLSLEVSNILFKYEGALSVVTVVVEASSYFLSSIMKAFVKTVRPAGDRAVLTVPYDPCLPAIAPLIRHRHKSLLDHDIESHNYLREPPLVGYVRPRNLREMLVRAALPAPPRARSLRDARGRFRPCRRRINCALCNHNPGVTNAYTCPVTETEISINQNITCTDFICNHFVVFIFLKLSWASTYCYKLLGGRVVFF